MQETTNASPQRIEQMSKEVKDQVKRIKRSVVMNQALNIQNVNLVMNGILLALISCATIAIFGWTSYLDEENRKIQTRRHTTIIDELQSQHSCFRQELRRMAEESLVKIQSHDANTQQKHDQLLTIFQEICKETRLSTPYPMRLTKGHTNEDFANMVRIVRWNKQWRDDCNTSLIPTAHLHCPRDLPKPQTLKEWNRLADVFYIESGLEIRKPTYPILGMIEQNENIPVTSIDQVDLDHLCRTPVCVEPDVLYSGKETKCQYCTEVCCNCNNCEKYRGFFKIRTMNINTGQINTWDHNRQQLVRSINQQNKIAKDKVKLRQVMKVLYQEAKQKQPTLPKTIEYLEDDNPMKEKIRSMAEEIMEGPKPRLAILNKKAMRLAEELNHELLESFLSKHTKMRDKTKDILNWILQQGQYEDEMKEKVLTKGGSDVVVISDSNMSLSVSSEDSTTVNTGKGLNASDLVWLKEGETTEDEHSLLMNEE